VASRTTRCSATSAPCAARILESGSLAEFREKRYASFDKGKGREFEKGKLSLADLRDIASKNGEPKQISGKQEWFENVLNDFIFRWA
jgi:xylose isomerase